MPPNSSSVRQYDKLNAYHLEFFFIFCDSGKSFLSQVRKTGPPKFIEILWATASLIWAITIRDRAGTMEVKIGESVPETLCVALAVAGVREGDTSERRKCGQGSVKGIEHILQKPRHSCGLFSINNEVKLLKRTWES